MHCLFVCLFFSRNSQPYVPKPAYPVGSVSQQTRTSATNCTHHQAPQHLPPSVMQLPLASLIRAGVAVPSGAQPTQSAPLTHHSTSSTSTSTTSNANQQQASASKDNVVMIDLDELPSPTKPMQEPFSLQAHQTHLNNNLVRMARDAFPSISPEFIKLLINQGSAQSSQDPNVAGSQAPIAYGSQAPIAHGSQASSIRPQASTQVVDIEGDSSANVDKTSSNSTSTTKNSALRMLLANSASGQGTAEVESTPTTIVQDVIMVLNQPDNPAPQETADVSSSPTPPTVQDVSTASNQPDNPAQQETADMSSSPTPPTVQDVSTASNQPDNPAPQDTTKVRSSPNPPTVNALRSSPPPHGETSKDSTSSKEQASSKE